MLRSLLRRQNLVALLATLLATAFMVGTFGATASAAGPSKIAKAASDVNTATSSELQTVKGIGLKTAAKIIAERDKNGPFTSLDDVQSRVKGVGAKTVQKFRAAGWVAKAKSKKKSSKMAGKTKGR